MKIVEPLFLLTFSAVVFSAEPTQPNYQCWMIPESRISYSSDWISLPWEGHKFQEIDNFGHEIESGIGTTLSIRWYEQKPGMDSSSFTKITLEFAGKELNAPLHTPTRANFVQGNVAFASAGSYRRGVDPGKILLTLATVEGRTHFSLDASVLMKPPLDDDKADTRTFQVDCDLETLAVSELTPWQGKPSQSFSSLHRPTLK